MKVTFLIYDEVSEFSIHGVETVGLSVDKLLAGIFSMKNTEARLFTGEIPKLQGVIPLYEELIDIVNDEDLRMIVGMYTDTGHKVIKLKFQMEMPDPTSQSNQLKDVRPVPISNASLPPESDMNAFEDLHEDGSRGPVINTLGRTSSMNTALHEAHEELNARDNHNISDDGTNTNHIADVSDGDSEDDLSEYSSSDNENFKSVSDFDEENEDALRLLSDEMMRNYFQQKDKNIDDFDVGTTFDDVYHFRRVMKEFSLQEDFPLERVKNEKHRVTFKCKREGCKWRIHASLTGVDKATFQIKTYDPDHTCDPFGKGSNEASAKWIAEKIKEDYELNPFIDINTIAMHLKKRHGVSVNHWKLYKAREHAMKMVSGDHSASYAGIPQYIEVLRRQDNRIFIKLKCDGLDISNPISSCRFERLFVCFPAQRDGFKYGCRPFIGIDGCFLKGPYGGQLLVATALDANFGIVPLAFMFAETESEATWGYFLECLQNYLDDPRCLTFMSDKQKGILNAVKKIYPTASNRYCARHRYDNFKAKYPGPKLRFLFYKAVRATNTIDFNMVMDEIKSVNEQAWQWLLRDDPKHWSLHAFDPHVKADHVTNNMTESFNAWIVKIRQLPILSLMEKFRRKCMKRFRSRFEKGTNWGSTIPPEVRNRLNLARKAGKHIYGFSNGDEFEVDDDRTYVVSLSQRTCQCGEWQLCGIPCKHAMACIHNRQADPINFVDPYFSTEAYLRTYKGKIPVVPDKIYWPEVRHPLILPPIKMRGKDKQGKDKQTLKGRPALNRRRAPDEPPKKMKRSNVVHCSKCKEMNHNTRTCPQVPENQRKNNSVRSRNSQAGENITSQHTPRDS